MRWMSALLLLLPLPATALPEFDALYDFERGRMTIGETRIRLERTQDDIYRYTSHSEATGFIKLFVDDVIEEESVFHFENGKFRAVTYDYRHSGSSKNRDESIAYNWKDNVAQVNYRGHESSIELEPGALDRFLLQLAISVDASRDALPRVYRIIDNGRIKEYELKITREERVRTPAGEFDTVRVERVDNTRDKSLKLWLAPELGYLPVRVEQEKRNEEPLRLILKRIDGPASESPTGSEPAKKQAAAGRVTSAAR